MDQPKGSAEELAKYLLAKLIKSKQISKKVNKFIMKSYTKMVTYQHLLTFCFGLGNMTYFINNWCYSWMSKEERKGF